MDPALIERLRSDLLAADYSLASVRSLLGEEADDARLRGVFAPARRSLAARGEGGRGAGRLGTLVSALLLGAELTAAELDAAFPELGAAGCTALGLFAAVPTGRDAFRVALSLNPVELVDAESPAPVSWWILSDLDDQLRGGPAAPEHVMGVGGATRSLIAQLPPGATERALDLGTGCGIVALHLALRGPVVATDLSARAIELARANAALNGVSGIDFRVGDLFVPVAGERFSLIASNPPFVVTPRGGDEPAYVYRDGGLVGDALVARVIREGAAFLADGGTLLCLANWECPWGVDGLERVRGWILEAADACGVGSSGAGSLGTESLGAWIMERDRVSPVRYAETWARDGGARPGDAEFERLVEAWLADFAARNIVAIGLGAIRIRRLEAPQPIVHAERAAGAFDPAPGVALERAFAAGLAAAGMSDAEALAARWILDPAVVEEREHTPGAEAPRAISLVTGSGIARRVTADTLLAAAVGACDGELSLGQIADALATILEVDAGAASEALVAGVRELAWLGMIAPATAA
ncbi:class I SAM-dependent methyltransferase [Leucobacter luti]|uniref:class I SAM-dependent methyltransferase n=1 Tax=Leucobacter luti TaxID=340320 RepID=UPI003D0125DB